MIPSKYMMYSVYHTIAIMSKDKTANYICRQGFEKNTLTSHIQFTICKRETVAFLKKSSAKNFKKWV